MPRPALWLGWLGTWACQPASVPPAEVQPGAPLGGEWYLAGALEMDRLGVPEQPGFSGAAELLGSDCKAAAQTTGGKPPPCRVERWQRVTQPGSTPPGRDSEAIHLVVGERSLLTLDGAHYRRKTVWRGLGPTLASCLQQAPLALPPAEDDDGLRLLVQDGAVLYWTLRFSGQNPCGLEGRLRLAIVGPTVDASGLAVQGVGWSEGGRDLAHIELAAWLRLLVRERWASLDDAERILVIQGLARDDEPEARQLLQGIAEGSSNLAANARRALDRQPSPAAEDP